MAFRLIYHLAVESHDLPALDSRTRSRVLAALEERLATSPLTYGKPLRGSLRNLWSLRVGDCRVIHQLAAGEVYVLLVGHRGAVYRDVLRRFRI